MRHDPRRDPVAAAAAPEIPTITDGSSFPCTRGHRGSLPTACHDARRLYRQGRYDDALSTVDGMFLASGRWAGLSEGHPPCDPAATRREAALLRTWCLIEQKDHAGAGAWLENACRLGHLAADDPALAVIELNLALFAGEHDLVRQRAQALLERIDDPADVEHAELRLLLGAALRWQGHLTAAVAHVEFACSAFTVLGEPARMAVSANFLGWTNLSLGRLDDARRWFEKSLETNTALGARLRMAQNFQNLAIVCYKQGDYEPAVELLEKELVEVEGLADMTCRAELALGQVRRLRGEHDAARAVLLEAYALAHEHDLAREESLALEYLGDILRDESHPAEAREFYRRAMAPARRIAPRGDLVMELLRREGECLDLEGRHTEANRVLNEALVVAGEVGDRFESAVIVRCLGVNAARMGRWNHADKMLDDACDKLKELTARHEAMIAAYELARVASREGKAGTGPGARARAVARAWRFALRAQQLSQEIGVPHLADEIGGLVAGLARRRAEGPQERPLWQAFSARRAPSSRVVAVSPAMGQVLRKCDGFARYDNPVLIRGEAGTGKELLARRIHENGARGARPFHSVSCAATADELLDREIFGRSVGGDGLKSGLVARAAGGTLLLLNIEELPRALQGKLLRLIQEGVYRPAGEGRELRSDVRVMATTETDLSALADNEGLRPDLYFRLRLMTVAVPPLRERREDIVPLLDHFLSRLEGATLTARTVFAVPGLQAMLEHDWPGNATELEAAARHSWYLRDQGRQVSVQRREHDGGATLEFRDDDGRGSGHPSGLTWESLTSLIERTGGNKSRTARHLGISRVTLYRWLKQLDPGTT